LAYSHISHRYPESHACAGPDPAVEAEAASQAKNAAGKALLAKNFPAAGGSSPAPATPSSVVQKKSANPKKAAAIQKVALMKLRHAAVPADPRDSPNSVTVEQRLHVNVLLESPQKREKAFWFRKVWN
jgi:hypothetical protein